MPIYGPHTQMCWKLPCFKEKAEIQRENQAPGMGEGLENLGFFPEPHSTSAGTWKDHLASTSLL